MGVEKLENVPFSVARSLFYSSLALSIILLVFLSPFNYPLYPNKALEYLTYWLDPIIFQIGTLGALLLLVYIWLGRRHPERKFYDIRSPFMCVSAFIVLLFFLEVRFDNFFASMFFGIESYWQPLEEPFITSWIEKVSGIQIIVTGDSTPSGFALRQWILTLGIFLILDQPDLYLKKRYGNAVRSISSLALIYVSLARIIRLAHVPTDIAVSIALGTIIFWGVFFLSLYY